MELRAYLSELDQALHLDPRERAEIIAEIHGHVDERALELEDQGLGRASATTQALWELGEPHDLAKEYYSSHSASSWRDILLAALPHLALAVIFAFHLWTDLLWVVVALSGAAIIAVLAWRGGRPTWTYPWLGYALAAPALSWALAMAAVGYGAWSFATQGTLPFALPLYLGIVLWVPISLSLVLRVARRVVLHDWLVVSLAALPMPFIATWFFLLHWHGGQLVPDKIRAMDAGTDTAMVFVALALTTALYMKVGKRSFRILLVLVTVPSLAALVASTYLTYPVSSPQLHLEGALRMLHQAPQGEAGSAFIIITTSVLTMVFLSSPILLNPNAAVTRWLRRLGRHHGVS